MTEKQFEKHLTLLDLGVHNSNLQSAELRINEYVSDERNFKEMALLDNPPQNEGQFLPEEIDAGYYNKVDQFEGGQQEESEEVFPE